MHKKDVHLCIVLKLSSQNDPRRIGLIKPALQELVKSLLSDSFFEQLSFPAVRTVEFKDFKT